jgi:hypothetical protein
MAKDDESGDNGAPERFSSWLQLGLRLVQVRRHRRRPARADGTRNRTAPVPRRAAGLTPPPVLHPPPTACLHGWPRRRGCPSGHSGEGREVRRPGPSRCPRRRRALTRRARQLQGPMLLPLGPSGP